jgi:hypothetical protein
VTTLATTNASKDLFLPTEETQLTSAQHTIILCNAFGAIKDEDGKVMTLRVEHFEPRAWELPLHPGEPLVSFAIDHGRVAFLAHNRPITVDGAEIRPNETGYIDLDGVSTLARPRQITIHCGDVLRHIFVSPRHVQHEGERFANMWNLTLREEIISFRRLFA